MLNLTKEQVELGLETIKKDPGRSGGKPLNAHFPTCLPSTQKWRG